jgi:azurin
VLPLRFFVSLALGLGILSLILAIAIPLSRGSGSTAVVVAPTPAAVVPTPTALPAATAAPGAAAAPAAPSGPVDATLDLATATGLTLAFAQTELQAPANSTVAVNFVNASDTLPHNWILVRGGDDVAEAVNTAALTSLPDYVPADRAQIIAASRLLQVGQNETITFETPEAGTYTFLCTFPGHYAAGMAGTLVVE